MREAKFNLVGTLNRRGVFYSSPACCRISALTQHKDTRRKPLQTFSFPARVSHDEDFYMRIPLPCFELVYFPQLSHLTKRKE